MLDHTSRNDLDIFEEIVSKIDRHMVQTGGKTSHEKYIVSCSVEGDRGIVTVIPGVPIQVVVTKYDTKSNSNVTSWLP